MAGGFRTLEREFFRLSVRLRNVLAHWYFRLREFDPFMLTLGEDLARLRLRAGIASGEVIAEEMLKRLSKKQ
jgi:hypothetical protein